MPVRRLVKKVATSVSRSFRRAFACWNKHAPRPTATATSTPSDNEAQTPRQELPSKSTPSDNKAQTPEHKELHSNSPINLPPPAYSPAPSASAPIEKSILKKEEHKPEKEEEVKPQEKGKAKAMKVSTTNQPSAADTSTGNEIAQLPGKETKRRPSADLPTPELSIQTISSSITQSGTGTVNAALAEYTSKPEPPTDVTVNALTHTRTRRSITNAAVLIAADNNSFVVRLNQHAISISCGIPRPHNLHQPRFELLFPQGCSFSSAASMVYRDSAFLDQTMHGPLVWSPCGENVPLSLSSSMRADISTPIHHNQHSTTFNLVHLLLNARTSPTITNSDRKKPITICSKPHEEENARIRPLLTDGTVSHDVYPWSLSFAAESDISSGEVETQNDIDDDDEYEWNSIDGSAIEEEEEFDTEDTASNGTGPLYTDVMRPLLIDAQSEDESPFESEGEFTFSSNQTQPLTQSSTSFQRAFLLNFTPFAPIYDPEVMDSKQQAPIAIHETELDSCGALLATDARVDADEAVMRSAVEMVDEIDTQPPLPPLIPLSPTNTTTTTTLPTDEQQPTRAVFLGNLDFTYPADKLLSLVSGYGVLKSFRTFPDKPYAFANFADVACAVKCKEGMDGMWIGRRRCRARFGKEEEEKGGGSRSGSGNVGGVNHADAPRRDKGKQSNWYMAPYHVQPAPLHQQCNPNPIHVPPQYSKFPAPIFHPPSFNHHQHHRYQAPTFQSRPHASFASQNQNVGNYGWAHGYPIQNTQSNLNSTPYPTYIQPIFVPNHPPQHPIPPLFVPNHPPQHPIAPFTPDPPNQVRSRRFPLPKNHIPHKQYTNTPFPRPSQQPNSPSPAQHNGHHSVKGEKTQARTGPGDEGLFVVPVEREQLPGRGEEIKREGGRESAQVNARAEFAAVEEVAAVAAEPGDACGVRRRGVEGEEKGVERASTSKEAMGKIETSTEPHIYHRLTGVSTRPTTPTNRNHPPRPILRRGNTFPTPLNEIAPSPSFALSVLPTIKTLTTEKQITKEEEEEEERNIVTKEKKSPPRLLGVNSRPISPTQGGEWSRPLRRGNTAPTTFNELMRQMVGWDEEGGFGGGLC
ncbi:hypothetical protein HDV00_003668 [Rhizophlyctis rosea]|nr:hypothetical protein HDV00_003668 [Rhizophlyctis rosea]